LFHIRTANVRHGTCFATLNREVLVELLASTHQTRYYVCQRNTYNEIVWAGAPTRASVALPSFK
jgi:hypothetical protein